MKRILCYGDSNTWGHKPGSLERFSRDIRWSGIVAQLLGPEYEIIEEGLSGRTTVWEDPRAACRNGYNGLGYALLSAKPIDMIVLSLGTNDLVYTDAKGSADGVAALIYAIKNAAALYYGSTPIFVGEPNILLVSPILVHESIPDRHKKSLLFMKNYKEVAKEENVHFVDAAYYAQPSGVDGIHMEAESHASLATALAKKITNLI